MHYCVELFASPKWGNGKSARIFRPIQKTQLLDNKRIFSAGLGKDLDMMSFRVMTRPVATCWPGGRFSGDARRCWC